MDYMLSLLGHQHPDFLFRALFLRQPPAQVRLALAGSNITEPRTLAGEADKYFAVCDTRPTYGAAVVDPGAEVSAPHMRLIHGAAILDPGAEGFSAAPPHGRCYTPSTAAVTTDAAATTGANLVLLSCQVDLIRGYHQVPVQLDDVPKMAVITPFGLFEFLRMPFGFHLNSASHPKEMASSSSSSEIGHNLEILTCSVCFNLYKDPIALSCGHSFCRVCLETFWENGEEDTGCRCPICREVFQQIPKLRKNVIIANLVENIQCKKRKVSLGVDVQDTELGDVKAEGFESYCQHCFQDPVKMCVPCEILCCEQHLKPHKKKRHKLVDPGVNIEKLKCVDHGKPIQLFCKNDGSLMCVTRTCGQHQNHKVVDVEIAHAELKDLVAAKYPHVSESMQSVASQIKQIQEEEQKTEYDVTEQFEFLQQQGGGAEQEGITIGGVRVMEPDRVFIGDIGEGLSRPELMGDDYEHDFTQRLGTWDSPMEVEFVQAQRSLGDENTGRDAEDRLEEKRRLVCQFVNESVDLMKNQIVKKKMEKLSLLAKQREKLEQQMESLREGKNTMDTALQELKAVSFLQGSKDLLKTIEARHTYLSDTDTCHCQRVVALFRVLHKVLVKEKFLSEEIGIIVSSKVAIVMVSLLKFRTVYVRMAQGIPYVPVFSLKLQVKEGLKYEALRLTKLDVHKEETKDQKPEETALRMKTNSRYYWEVNVKLSRSCRIGICLNSIGRKGEKSGLGMNDESWCLQKHEKLYSAHHNLKKTVLSVSGEPKRVGFFLDCEVGELTCIGDSQVLHVFRGNFLDEVKPAIGVFDDGSVQFSLF
uniref:E3 ubiquitin/ISG15 ligase TRIM25-like n=1 Tax=Myxine glutinosa TaxID=7769 RepID=UPI00358F21F4